MRASRASSSAFRGAQSTRFSLLLLEDGEYFLDDFGVFRFLEPSLTTHRKVQGRLKVCTRGFFFVPQDIQLPILRFPFRAMTLEPCAECFVEFSEDRPVASSYVSASVESTYLAFQTNTVVEMKERGIDHPYVYKDTTSTNSSTPFKYIFTLLYSRLDAFLASIHIIYEVAKLPRRSMNKVDEENLLATVLVPRMVDDFDTSLLVDFREKLLLPAPEMVDRVAPLLKYPGCIMLTNLRLYFQPAQLNNVLDPVLNWEYADIERIFKRRYLLRRTGLEIYLKTGESFFFSFKSPQARDDIYAMMVNQPDLQHCRREDLELMMRKWQQREISNFEYLQFLNNAAGRTRNDLTQYPVFPWILSDYTSSSLDLADPSVYRDLSKPIGALNAERLEYFKMRYEIMPRGEEAEGMPPPFLYGTHYSTPGYVLYYLVRMAPQFMLCLQNGKFDAPDRLFRSIDVTWQGCVTNQTDLKELIPEFFDTSAPSDEWLRNSQHLDLGTTQSLNRVDDVELPLWAHRDPHEFVRKNREALESDYVSEHLHEWIDLIFGYKQQGDEAIKANNLFYYLSYEGSVDLESVLDPMEKCSLESQIQEFGQTPRLLFSTPHPCRNENESKSKIEIATPDLLPSPRIRQQRVRRLTYPPPDGISVRYRGRRPAEMASLAFFNEEDSDDEQLVPLEPRRSFQPGLSLMCFQAPWEGVPKAIEFSSHLWNGMGGGGGKPAKKWHWKHKMKTNPGMLGTWSWTESLSYSLHAGEITSAVLTRDDATLFTACKDSSLKISKIADGTVRQTVSCRFALSCCDVSPDERTILVGCWDNCVYMYSARTGREMDKVLAHSDGISAICIVGNRFLTSSWDSTVKLWRYTPTFIMATPVCTFTECEESVLCLDTSPNGAFGAAGTRNGHVYLFNLNTPAFHGDVFVSPTRRGDVSSVSFASDSSSYVCITMENELMQFNLQGEQLFSINVGAPGQVRCFESDGEYAVGGTTNGRIFFWKLHEEIGSELVCEIPNAHDTIISSLVVSGNGSTLVSAAIDGSVHVWRLASKSKADLNSESSSRKSSITRTVSVASKTETSFAADLTKTKAKVNTTRNSVSKASLQVSRRGYRDATEHLRPLSHLWRPDLAYTMEESHLFFEGQSQILGLHGANGRFESKATKATSIREIPPLCASPALSIHSSRQQAVSMEESLYDEFGNYIGPELRSSDDEDSGSESEAERSDSGGRDEDDSDDESRPNYGYDPEDLETSRGVDAMVLHNSEMEDDSAIVLHEDKKYYPDAHEVYGDAETLVMEEDAQTIETPIIEPVKIKSFSVLEQAIPKTTYSTEFMTSLMDHPQLIRHVAVIGDLHHGKTLFTDLLVQQTHVDKWDPAKERRYTDTRKDEQERKVSIKSTPVSLVLPSSRGKHYLVNLIDCPGHVNFSDESTTALQISDGAVLVVDAIEGIMMNTERLIKAALKAHVPLLLVINKVDRLIIELKLPPVDAYFKLLHTIEEVNAIIEANSPAGYEQPRLSPELGNVCFSSGQHGWSFTLESFAQLYAQTHPGISAADLAPRLWGDKYYSPQTRTFKKKVPYENAPRSFVLFILEPLYKIYSKVLGEDPQQLAQSLRSMGLRLRKEELNLNPRPLLKLVLAQFVGNAATGFVDMVVRHVPSPLETAKTKVGTLYSGNQSKDLSIVKGMLTCDPKAPLMINIVKLYSSPDGTTFSAFGRVYSGEVRQNQKITVLGDAYSAEDDEDMSNRTVEGTCISQGRYKIEVNRIPAGNWVMLEGIDASITKSATITSANEDLLQDDEVGIFQPIQKSFGTTATMKLAVEPLNPAELPKMLEGLRKISKSYPLVRTKVEESGEHVILCTGELASDCILHDLRRMYAEIEIKVADPVVAFCETVAETSSVQCFAETPNRKNKLTMIAEPLDNGLAQDIESGVIRLDMDKKDIAGFFQSKYNWDVLAARSVWAFGPESNGPNVLLDDTLSTEVNKKSLGQIKDSIVQGFQWSCREGPLCDEPIRNAKFKILDATIASDMIHRGGGQVIPTARRVAYSAFLTATPRILEPIYSIEIQCPADTVSSLYQVLSRRRGHITHDAPKAGSPLYTVRGFVPVIESFGLETDLRVFTQGQAFITQVFDHWAVVPGDPLDTSVVLRPLEPAPVNDLAREFMIKTRRRKGLSEDVNVSKYFDEPMLRELAKHEIELQHLL